MQLIKLTYIAHGWTLAVLKKPLFRESVEAWQYGPVLPQLYQAIKEYRSLPVGVVKGAKPITLSPDEDAVIRRVCELYGHLDGIQLSQLTHERGTPWDVTWHPDERSSVIPNAVIRLHYERLARDRAPDEDMQEPAEACH